MPDDNNEKNNKSIKSFIKDFTSPIRAGGSYLHNLAHSFVEWKHDTVHKFNVHVGQVKNHIYNTASKKIDENIPEVKEVVHRVEASHEDLKKGIRQGTDQFNKTLDNAIQPVVNEIELAKKHFKEFLHSYHDKKPIKPLDEVAKKYHQEQDTGHKK